MVAAMLRFPISNGWTRSHNGWRLIQHGYEEKWVLDFSRRTIQRLSPEAWPPYMQMQAYMQVQADWTELPVQWELLF